MQGEWAVELRLRGPWWYTEEIPKKKSGCFDYGLRCLVPGNSTATPTPPCTATVFESFFYLLKLYVRMYIQHFELMEYRQSFQSPLHKRGNLEILNVIWAYNCTPCFLDWNLFYRISNLCVTIEGVYVFDCTFGFDHEIYKQVLRCVWWSHEVFDDVIFTGTL
jgi:hypothetical protein